VNGSLWFYAPNKVAPVVFAVLFAVSASCHIYQCIRYKSWKVSVTLPIAAFLFVAGYSLREYGAFHYNKLAIYIESVVFLYAAPPLYELSNYFMLSRILYYVPYHSPLHPGRVLTTFSALSMIVEALNGNGAASVANTSATEKRQEIGRALLKTALVLQLVILGLFLLLATSFHRTCKRANVLPKNLKAVLITLYISSALIGVRTIYRTVEYFSISQLKITKDTDLSTLSPLLRYEWYFWVFEAMLMVTNSFLLNVRHPMRFLPRDNCIYLAEDGVTEIQGPGYEDKRLWIVTILDPFDIHGMMKGRNMNQRFWETHSEGRVLTSSAKDDAEKAVST